jgi:hypothetical protein
MLNVNYIHPNLRRFELANVLASNTTVVRQTVQSAGGPSWIRRLKSRSINSNNKST